MSIPFQAQGGITVATGFLVISAVVSLSDWAKKLLWPKQAAPTEQKSPSKQDEPNKAAEKSIQMDPLVVGDTTGETFLEIMVGSASEAVGKGITSMSEFEKKELGKKE